MDNNDLDSNTFAIIPESASEQLKKQIALTIANSNIHFQQLIVSPSLSTSGSSTPREEVVPSYSNGFAKFLACDNMTPSDLDEGVNQMALVLAVILTIPYQVGGATGYAYFNWLSDELRRCPKEAAGGYNFEDAIAAFREYMLCCMFSSMIGMIFSTFYYLFKRSHPKDLKAYMRQSRLLTIYIFICCGFALISLMTLSNFLLSWYVMGSGEMCKGTIYSEHFLIGGIIVVIISTMISLYLVY